MGARAAHNPTTSSRDFAACSMIPKDVLPRLTRRGDPVDEVVGGEPCVQRIAEVEGFELLALAAL